MTARRASPVPHPPKQVMPSADRSSADAMEGEGRTLPSERHFRPIEAPSDAAAFIARSTMFCRVGARRCDWIARQSEWMHAQGGEEWSALEGPAAGLLIVISGRLRVSVKRCDGTTSTREIPTGGTCGEDRLLVDDHSGVRIVALRDTVLARLSSERFRELLDECPQLVLQIARSLAQRVSVHERDRGLRSMARPRTVAVVPLSRDAPLTEFTSRLAQAAPGSLHLTADRIDALLGTGSAEEFDDAGRYEEITRWLNDQEEAHSLVIFESTMETSRWAQRCVRQADCILAVAVTDAGPRDGEIAPAFFEVAAARHEARLWAVLVHADGAMRPRATLPWLALGRFAGHYHVRSTSRGDFERVVRSILGRSLGLVLGGGGARAYAHIGVIRALEEANLCIDRIGGTSTGALIAAQYAYGYEADGLAALNRRGWIQRRPLTDYAMPVTALLSGKGAKQALEEWFGNECIEDMWLPFFCVSANLTRAEVRVHRLGSIATAIRASASVPGIAPPVQQADGDLLVDGAVLNNLPVDVMRGSAEGPVIAVDVSRLRDSSMPRNNTYAKSPPGGQLVRRSRLEKVEGRLPRILQIVLRASLLPSSSLAKQMREEADLYLAPPVEQFDLFGWNALDEIVEAGYRHTREVIDRRRSAQEELIPNFVE